ncbi:MAG: FAD-dependent oxidoreductase [Rubinisphaera brasiliensis]|uniref:FAD-dependent oxidoreductase n=1 Tax=Rubinisphaera brasiliensis TaxID=119 RepID=UPI0039193658
MLLSELITRRGLLAVLCLLTLSVAAVDRVAAADGDLSADVVILSGSEAGFTAAIQAARMGKTVLLIEPTGHPGGMAVEGIAGDIKHNNQTVVTGLAREFYRQVDDHYGRTGPELRGVPSYEPHAAEAVIEEMLAAQAERVTIVRGQRIREGAAGVEKDGAQLTAVVLEDGRRLAGQVFIDASIEGHLLHFAGVSTVTGREGNAAHSETLNGVRGESRHRNFTVRIDPYIEPGNPASGLIATVQQGALEPPGSPDPHIMGFCFRLCLTRKAELMVPIEQPSGYRPEDYEIYRRYFAAGGKLFSPSGRLPNGKTDLGSWHDLSANLYGENVGYPDGSYAEQDAIVQNHERFTRGLIWFLQNDPDVPDSERRKWAGWGLCRDEFPDNNHWPRRLYIRSARRMVSDFVHTEHHMVWPDPKPVEDPVTLAWWPADMHHARRIVRDGAVYNEGFVYGDGGWSPFGVSYRALTPKRNEATNLLTPTCPSSTYVAYGGIRILCTFMMLGQATGTAAALAIDEDIPVQDLNYPQLQSRLKQDGLILELPENAHWDGKKKIKY